MDALIDLTRDDSEVEAGGSVISEYQQAFELGTSSTTSTHFSESRFQLHVSASVAGSSPRGSGSGLGTGFGSCSNLAEPRPPSRPLQATGATSEPTTSHPMGQNHSTSSNSETNRVVSAETVDLMSADVTPQTSSSATKMAARKTPTPSKAIVNNNDNNSTTPGNDTMTPRRKEWSGEKVASSLLGFAKELDQNHAKLVYFNLKTATQPKFPERRHLSATADLADLKMPTLPFDTKQQDVMRVQLKLHKEKDPSRVNAGKKKMAYEVTCIKSNKKSVPKYRFHHVEISRNVLTPNTCLKFIPHLKDMKDGEEERYRRWINELEAMDVQSGFNATSSNRAEKANKMLKVEMAIELSFYIDRWIAKLGLEDCTKASLVRYMATQSENDDKMTPQQKNSIMNKLSDDVASPRAIRAATMFTDAFNNLWRRTGVTLKDILVHDETVEAVVESKKLVKDGFFEPEKQGVEQLLDAVESNLASYTILGCLFCYCHSCEHGDHDRENNRRPIAVEAIGKFEGLARQNLALSLAKTTETPNAVEAPKVPPFTPCGNRCYLLYQTGPSVAPVEPWAEEDIVLLQGLYIALCGRQRSPMPCFTSAFIGRYCWEIHRKALDLGLDKKGLERLANKVDPIQQPVKGLPWYDRFRKELKGDWQEQCNVHDFTRREVRDPCNHAGPCGKDCPCVDAKLLCDRFCRCTVENCAHKYTGCACQANGKTCLQQKAAGRPCICVQLNRECDPVLCTGCGALERADPKNAHDLDLHATGCQNVALQRGVTKAVLLGESQIEGCGYGLFAAEDITQDEFVIEYLGELISHDEGVRREARRGDVFDESNHSSYLFTLLDYEGIWVDAAIYGNLSRYINHASETDKVGRKRVNIVPQILFVNGDFRIKFKALRDIKAGEELFFNYGENFPNLTKKLLDSKDGEGSRPKRGGSRGGGRGGRGGRGRGGRGRGSRGSGIKFSAETKKAPVPALLDEEEDLVMSNSAFEELDDDDDDDFILGRAAGRKIKAKRGAATSLGPRGGRKRKRESDDDVKSAEHDPKGPSSSRTRGGRAGLTARGWGRGRATRGSRGGARGGARATNGGSLTTTAAFVLDEDIPDGREPKLVPAPTIPFRQAEVSPPRPILGTPSSKAGRVRRRKILDGDDDEEDGDFKASIQRSGSSHHSPSLRRRRRQQIPDSDDDMVDAGDDEHHTPTRRTRAGTEGGESLEGSSPMDRSQRKRQRPARYRDLEE